MDFLLGRVQDVIPGDVHEWVAEHQARLQAAFEGARERLQVAAGRRKANHDQQVRDVPLAEGQLVYLRECGRKGRQKIQDLWSPVVHQVVRAPKEGGVVYSVVPVGEPNKIKHVHRSLLKVRHSGELPVQGPQGFPPAQQVLQEEEEEVDDVDLLRLVPGEHWAPGAVRGEGLGNGEPSGVGAIIPPSVVPLRSDVGPETREAREPVVGPEVITGPSVEEDGLRRTTRATAGCHSNVHRLPRAVGVSTSDTGLGAVSNMVSVLFRPWY